jgi:hypothetical protein
MQIAQIVPRQCRKEASSMDAEMMIAGQLDHRVPTRA